MQDSKKAVYKTVAFLLCIALLSVPFFYLYDTYNIEKYYTAAELAENDGKLDVLICGASQGQMAFIPEQMDESLHCNSFNLAMQATPVHSRYILGVTYAEKNPVKTMIVELSEDALTNTSNLKSPDPHLLVIQRLPGFEEKLSYFIQFVRPLDYLHCYLRMMSEAKGSILNLMAHYLTGADIVSADYAGKGYRQIYKTAGHFDVPALEAAYQTEEIETEVVPESFDALLRLFDYCDENGIRVVVVTVPESDYFTNTYTNMDDIYTLYQSICEERGYLYFDFNLLKDKPSIFPDDTAYYNVNHLNVPGASTFTSLFCEYLTRTDQGEKLDELFYLSYAEKLYSTR